MDEIPLGGDAGARRRRAHACRTEEGRAGREARNGGAGASGACGARSLSRRGNRCGARARGSRYRSACGRIVIAGLMASLPAGPEIEKLVQLLAKLPGLGPRSARRAALVLLKKREALLEPLATAMQEAAAAIRVCETCGNLDTVSPCSVCRDERRDRHVL